MPGNFSTLIDTLAARPFLHVAMDDFIGMLPERLMGHRDGMVFEPGEDAGPPSINVRSGPMMDRVGRRMRHAIAALAGQGNDVIVDDVMFDPEEEAEGYRRLNTLPVTAAEAAAQICPCNGGASPAPGCGLQGIEG